MQCAGNGKRFCCSVLVMKRGSEEFSKLIFIANSISCFSCLLVMLFCLLLQVKYYSSAFPHKTDECQQ